MNTVSQMTEFIKTDTPFLFARYGDGEYYAATYRPGGNCDRTPYTKNLGDKVRASLIYNSQQPNAIIGKWHIEEVTRFWQSLVEKEIPWGLFMGPLLDQNIFESSDKLEFYRAIKECKRKKIYISNPRMGRAKALLNIDLQIGIHPSNWFDTQYNELYAMVCKELEVAPRSMVLISGGMGSKYLISELHKRFPETIYIDIGSGLDKLCMKIDTRNYHPPYDKLVEYMKTILPVGWD